MSEETRNFLNSYGDFVTKVTSEPSMNQSSLDERMKEKKKEWKERSTRLRNEREQELTIKPISPSHFLYLNEM